MVVAKLSLSLSPMYVDMNRNSDPTGNPSSVSHQSSWPVIWKRKKTNADSYRTFVVIQV